MKRYKLTLLNQSENLDLTLKKDAIKEVLDYLVFDKNQKDIKAVSIISIEKKIIELEVEENNKNWHKRFGKILKNKYGMSNFCDLQDQNKLFKW